MKVYSVTKVEAIFNCYEVGLYETLEKAIDVAEKIAVENNYQKIDPFTWGEEDDYGLLEGVTITEKGVQ